ncbi:MAG: 4Fe-4S ferredoxin [Candidatus Adiutrix intracellularis]|jgi:uncharacterized Fe-S center protein|nr:MAG: 4Fe-4S ferredoxin [Candidatus Adiutrix intracellularis]MDR2826733.1 DUF362 domain-containing protein [Candidatus Adiutrix intracellularis]
MEKSKVFFTDMRCRVGVSLLDKLDRLIIQAGIEEINFKKKFVAIKLHFGEPGNLAFLRPNFAKTVADHIKKLDGLPFLTDCNTLYVGRRNNALWHLEAALENGYSSLSTGCQMIIADGLKGGDDLEVPIAGGVFLKSAWIGRAVMDADVIISLNHFKGHEATGFGGAIKNIGMGCGSRAGKMAMHSDGKPSVIQEKCVGCRTCIRYCAQEAISFGTAKKAFINSSRCVGCGRCLGVCNYDAIGNLFDDSNDRLCAKMVEYAKAVLDGRPHFHISVINQVSPYCDCHGENDAAVVPDIGIFAGFDPVALDAACIEAVNAAPSLSGSIINDREQDGIVDHFTRIHLATDWRVQLTHAEKIGLGHAGYKLINVY